MKLIRRTVLAAAAVAAFAAPYAALAQDIKPRLIRFGYGLNEQSNQGRAVKVFADEVLKASGGKMRVRAVGAAALGPDTQMQQALIGGAQEMMVGSTATLVGITKEMALWDTPFLFNTAKEADTVLDGPIGQKVMDKLQEKGLVGLAYWENGFRNLTNSKRPVTRRREKPRPSGRGGRAQARAASHWRRGRVSCGMADWFYVQYQSCPFEPSASSCAPHPAPPTPCAGSPARAAGCGTGPSANSSD